MKITVDVSKVNHADAQRRLNAVLDAMARRHPQPEDPKDYGVFYLSHHPDGIMGSLRETARRLHAAKTKKLKKI